MQKIINVMALTVCCMSGAYGAAAPTQEEGAVPPFNMPKPGIFHEGDLHIVLTGKQEESSLSLLSDNEGDTSYEEALGRLRNMSEGEGILLTQEQAKAWTTNERESFCVIDSEDALVCDGTNQAHKVKFTSWDALPMPKSIEGIKCELFIPVCGASPYVLVRFPSKAKI